MKWTWEDSYPTKEAAEYWADASLEHWEETKVVEGGEKSSSQFPFVVWRKGNLTIKNEAKE